MRTASWDMVKGRAIGTASKNKAAAIAIIMKKKGKKKPTADSASAPNPDTHKASTKLYNVCTDIATIIGTESLMIACFGFPSSVLTPSVCCVCPPGAMECTVDYMVYDPDVNGCSECRGPIQCITMHIFQSVREYCKVNRKSL